MWWLLVVILWMLVDCLRIIEGVRLLVFGWLGSCRGRGCSCSFCWIVFGFWGLVIGWWIVLCMLLLLVLYRLVCWIWVRYSLVVGWLEIVMGWWECGFFSERIICLWRSNILLYVWGKDFGVWISLWVCVLWLGLGWLVVWVWRI